MKPVLSYLTLSTLAFCCLSGLVLALCYHPSTAHESLIAISKLSFGSYFLEFHYFSAQLSLILCLLHALSYLFADKKSFFGYFCGILGLFLLIFLAFSGFTLRMDLGSKLAFAIAKSFLNQLDFLIRDNKIDIFRMYIYHILILPIFLFLFLKAHCKLAFKHAFLALGLCLAMLFFLPYPPLINPLLKQASGPWYFLPAEKLLIAGLHPSLILACFALFFLLLLASFRFLLARVFLLIFLLAYAYFY